MTRLTRKTGLLVVLDAPAGDDDGWDFDERSGTAESLQDHLLWQFNVVPLSEVDRAIGIAIIDAATAAVSWVGSDPDGGNAINVRTVSADGTLGPVKPVGHSALKRIHPQLANSDQGLVLAWTESIDQPTRVATALVPVRKTRDR